MAAPNRYIAAALERVRKFNLGYGHCVAGSRDCTPLLTPLEIRNTQPPAGRSAAPSAADLAADWAPTLEAEFLELANGALRGYCDRLGTADPGYAPVPGLDTRASAVYSDCKQLQTLFNSSLTLAQKALVLRGEARSAAESLVLHRRRGPAGSIGQAKLAKRAAGKKSRLSGKYGDGKRSPHVAKVNPQRARSPVPTPGDAIAAAVAGTAPEDGQQGIRLPRGRKGGKAKAEDSKGRRK